jgi:hypothetical protein
MANAWQTYYSSSGIVELQNCQVFWRPGPVITMAAPNRNYYYSKLFIEFSYIRRSNLKYVKHRKSNC